ncbi:MAG: GerMN domain-containing protein [Alkaliphilus sp.]
MLKIIKNVLLIIIVCITATGVPIFADIASAPELEETKLPVEIAMTVSVDAVDNAKYQVAIKMFDKNSVTSLPAPTDSPVILEIYHNELFVKSVDLEDVWNSQKDSQLAEDDNVITDFITTIDQENFNLPDGIYELKVIPNIKEIDSSLTTQTFSLSLHSGFTYIPSLESIARNNMGLILYFPDTEFINLIPVTRIIPFTSKPLRATLNNLLAGVNEATGLPTGAFTPDRIRLGLVDRTAQLFMPTDIGRFETNSTDARIALNSLVNSLNTIHAVRRVQFYFNNQIVESAFHGHSMDKPYYPVDSNLFVGTRTKTNRVMLTPIPFFDKNIAIEDLFNRLKFNYNKAQFSFNIIPTVPAEVTLYSFTVDNKTLTLELSPSFLTVYEGNVDMQNLMVESILHTFTSLPDITHIQFDVKDTTVTTIGRYPIGVPIRPSRYINPEMQN